MEENNNMSKQNILPVLVSRNIVVFPGAKVSIEIGRKMSVAATFWANTVYDQEIIIICQKDYDKDEPQPDDLYSMGTLCKIETTKSDEAGSLNITLRGIHRVKTSNVTLYTPDEYERTLGEGIAYRVDFDRSQNYWQTEYKIVKNRNSASPALQKSISELINQMEETFGRESPECGLIRGIAKNRPDKIALIADICAQM